MFLKDSASQISLLAQATNDWPPTIVAVVVLTILAVVTVVALFKHKMHDVLMLMGVVGTLFGAMIGMIGTYFFANDRIADLSAKVSTKQQSIVQLTAELDSANKDKRVQTSLAVQYHTRAQDLEELLNKKGEEISSWLAYSRAASLADFEPYTFLLQNRTVELSRVDLFESAFRDQEQGRLDEAEQQYRIIISESSELPDDVTVMAMNNLATLLLETGSIDEASSLIEEVRRLDDTPLPDVWHTVSAIKYKEGNLAAAIQAVSQAIHLAPDNVEYRLDSARILQEMGRLDEAREQFTEALSRIENLGDIAESTAKKLEELHLLMPDVP